MPTVGYDNGKNIGLQEPAVLAFRLNEPEESHFFTLNFGLFSQYYKSQMKSKELYIRSCIIITNSFSLTKQYQKKNFLSKAIFSLNIFIKFQINLFTERNGNNTAKHSNLQKISAESQLSTSLLSISHYIRITSSFSHSFQL